MSEITRENMFELLLADVPTFQPDWDEFLEEWSEEADRGEELPLYLALGSLATHLINLLEEGRERDLRAAFAVVERWHLEGDSYVRAAATVGLLEDLSNRGLHRTTTIEQFVPYLSPVSRRQWDEVLRFWGDTGH